MRKENYYCLICTKETTHIIAITLDNAEMWVCEKCVNKGIYKGLIT